MRIGVFPSLTPAGGGIYQYSLTIIRALNEWQTDDELILILESGADVPPECDEGRWVIKRLPAKEAGHAGLNTLRKIIGEGPHRELWRAFRKKIDRFVARNGQIDDLNFVRARRDLETLFGTWKLDLAIYTWPTPISFESGIPFVMAIHDIQHRLHPEFPEVSADGEWNGREYCLRNGSRYATVILVDSEIGKEDVLSCYAACGLTADRVKVLPFVPPPYVNQQISKTSRRSVRDRYGLPERYLFYPAQFWPHKNHLRIIQALGVIKQRYGLSIPIVLCGSYTGAIREKTFSQMTQVASELGLEAEICYLGYVPDQDIAAIYSEAAALVMPTFFGPTNIPILEAWAHDCPVLTSDIRGIREQVGDAGVLVDPNSIHGLARGIHRIWTDHELATNLKKVGRQRLSQYGPADFQLLLVDAIEEAKSRVLSREARRAS